ncbi:hypothetical protein KGM_212426 [Danaus plexippus plexippus]|uniref:Uncharacterized protein n=2 Tax=Danaus plexippus TaxID=13037 RepID=A0A212EHL2_DANPL|nr:hypothetical protein KGM_212426 [Danaus plexippus plexippus]
MELDKCVLVVLLLLGLLSPAAARTIFLEEDIVTFEEVSFLKKYGYLSEQGFGSPTYTAQSIAEAVRSMQTFAGLPPTGQLDSETRKLFKRKRCGVKDIETKSNKIKRYILQQGWGRKAITYRVINGSSTLEKSRVEALMANALAVWAPHGNLRFKSLSSAADIQVSFASKDHGDGFPFDGPGHVVAHAFPPPHGAMHFDDDEQWGDNANEEDEDVTDFFAVAVHEVGHALGLSHSNVKSSVMYPYYQVPVEKLHEDDILGMQELYLKEQPSSAEIAASFTIAPRSTVADSDENLLPDLCYANYDTLQVIQNKLYVFEEEWVWVLSERKIIEEGYPKRFHDVFVGLPRHFKVIRTIYENRNGHIVIFSGRSYFAFSSRFHLIKRGRITDFKIPSRVAELTTVFLSNYNNKTYLIDDERYWRYDEDTETMDKGYPKQMSAWRDVPYPVDAALIWKGDTFFFRGPRFWRFDNKSVKAHPYYPLPTAVVWFPCEPTPDIAIYLTNSEP